MTSKKFELKNLKLEEISIVDSPANKGSKVVLFKHDQQFVDTRQKPTGNLGKTRSKKNDGGLHMDPKELAKRLEALEKANKELDDKVAAGNLVIKSFNEAVKTAGLVMKSSEDGKISIEKGKAKEEDETVMFNGEKILKSAIPAPVLKMLEEQGKELSEIKKSGETLKLEKRAEAELSNLAGNTASKVALLKAVDGIEDDAERAEVLKSLKAADVATSDLFKSVGNAQIDESTPTFKLEKLAKDYATKNDVTFEQGYAEVTKSGDGRELYAASRAEAN